VVAVATMIIANKFDNNIQKNIMIHKTLCAKGFRIVQKKMNPLGEYAQNEVL
jgi:hypothetical protein